MRYLLDFCEFFNFSLFYQSLLELIRHIKMILNRSLATTRDNDDICYPSRYGLFDEILDHWFVYDWEHFFGLSLGRWEEPSPESCSRDDTLTDD